MGGAVGWQRYWETFHIQGVNRFLLRERYEPKDLFNITEKIINLVGGILSVDDTVIEKIYSDPKNVELIGYFWSGKYHKTIIGLNKIIEVQNFFVNTGNNVIFMSKHPRSKLSASLMSRNVSNLSLQPEVNAVSWKAKRTSTQLGKGEEFNNPPSLLNY